MARQKRTRKRLDAWLATRKKLPTVDLYHGTTVSAAKKIARQGLLTRGADFSFLTSSKRAAAYYAGSRGAVLTLKIPKKFYDRRIHSSVDARVGHEEHELLTRRNLPGHWVHRITNAKGAAIKGWITRKRKYGPSGVSAGARGRRKGKR